MKFSFLYIFFQEYLYDIYEISLRYLYYNTRFQKSQIYFQIFLSHFNPIQYDLS